MLIRRVRAHSSHPDGHFQLLCLLLYHEGNLSSSSASPWAPSPPLFPLLSRKMSWFCNIELTLFHLLYAGDSRGAYFMPLNPFNYSLHQFKSRIECSVECLFIVKVFYVWVFCIECNEFNISNPSGPSGLCRTFLYTCFITVKGRDKPKNFCPSGHTGMRGFPLLFPSGMTTLPAQSYMLYSQFCLSFYFCFPYHVICVVWKKFFPICSSTRLDKGELEWGVSDVWAGTLG